MKSIGKIAAIVSILFLFIIQINLYFDYGKTIAKPIGNQNITNIEKFDCNGLHDIESNVNIIEFSFDSSSSNHFLQKKLLKDFTFFTKITDQLSVSKFQQYNLFSLFQIERLKTTDLIFPFHYFL